MNKSRRTFVKNSALAVAGATLFSNRLFAAIKSGEIVGVQLYSVRDDMKKDPLGTLKLIAEMGYKDVEHANYIDRKFYGYSATEFKKILSDLGLKMTSGHTVMGKDHWDASKNDFTDAWKYTVEDAATVGQKYVISPWLDESLRKTYDDTLRYMEVFNKSGELCQKSGMKFGYHNHDFEFSVKLNDKTLYDIILQNTDPKLVVQQLDIGNMVGGGGYAMEILKKYPGRFESMHVKDEIKSQTEHNGYESTILGKGIVGTKQVLDWGRKSGGTTHFVVEQESYQGKTPIESVKEDLKIMKKWGYA
ncbi:sugar phosphate isomerase/epimerase family protein [Rubrolithibacter danxiaensis]|uniref:sugar phosphate isomerase/epimerase family protein n=1 Tax=Rubrolithibacter danxiaensis TaxID=3390805 RepID=UPI003BF8BF83